jgi:hypothetical protein
MIFLSSRGISGLTTAPSSRLDLSSLASWLPVKGRRFPSPPQTNPTNFLALDSLSAEAKNFPQAGFEIFLRNFLTNF